MRYIEESGKIEMTAEEQSYILNRIKDIKPDERFVYPSANDVETNLLSRLDDEKTIWYAFFLIKNFSIVKLPKIEQRDAYKIITKTLEEKIKIVSVSEYFSTEVSTDEL